MKKTLRRKLVRRLLKREKGLRKKVNWRGEEQHEGAESERDEGEIDGVEEEKDIIEHEGLEEEVRDENNNDHQEGVEDSNEVIEEENEGDEVEEEQYDDTKEDIVDEEGNEGMENEVEEEHGNDTVYEEEHYNKDWLRGDYTSVEDDASLLEVKGQHVQRTQVHNQSEVIVVVVCLVVDD
ncbi:hypothetical protein Sjap_017708 [Stephania japonica]|uniref:Uncharacterized protein n=1 Tax=Stephania japonica TaxID=461633 RepID=A0AAP0I6N8_9MAGN